jgi:hypothetical protein
LLRSSHPPITAMARPTITRISARADPRRGRLVTFGGEIAGTAAGACLAA